MNTIKAVVKKVIGEPLYSENEFDGEIYKRWTVGVEYEDMGGIKTTELVFKNKEEAEKVEEGYEFHH